MNKKNRSSQNWEARKETKLWILLAFLFPVFGGEGIFINEKLSHFVLFALCAGVLFLSLFSVFKQRRKIGFSSADSFLFLFSTWSALSLIWTISFDHTIYLLIPILIGTLAYMALSDKTPHASMVKAMVLSTGVLSIYALVQTIDIKLNSQGASDLALEQIQGFRPSSFFKSPNTYASFLSILFPLNLYLLLSCKGKTRIHCGLTLFLNVLGLYMVAARGPAILAVFSSLALVFYMTRSGDLKFKWGKKALWILFSVLGVLIGFHLILAFTQSQSLILRLLDFNEMTHNALALRIYYWKAAFGAFLEQPILGSGLNTLQQTIFSHLEEGTYTRFPHNILLQFLAEIGFPGALFFLISCLLIIKRGLHKQKDPFLFSCGLGFLNLIIYALVDITFQCTAIVFLFFVLAAIICRPYQRSGLKPVFILIVAVLGLYGGYYAYYTFMVKINLEKIKSQSLTAIDHELKKTFDEALKKPNTQIRKVYGDWRLYQYSKSKNHNHFKEGVKQLILAYESSGRNPKDALEIADAYFKGAKHKEAEEWYIKALDGFPGSLKIWRQYAVLLVRLGRDDVLIKQLPGVLQRANELPRMQRYYRIDIFDLELKLAALYERNRFFESAFKKYSEIYIKYTGAGYLEAIDPFSSQCVRIPIQQHMDFVKKKRKELNRKRRKP